jgi:hypothetical protein
MTFIYNAACSRSLGTVSNDNIFQCDYYKETIQGFKKNYYALNTRITLNNLCTSF